MHVQRVCVHAAANMILYFAFSIPLFFLCMHTDFLCAWKLNVNIFFLKCLHDWFASLCQSYQEKKRRGRRGKKPMNKTRLQSPHRYLKCRCVCRFAIISAIPPDDLEFQFAQQTYKQTNEGNWLERKTNIEMVLRARIHALQWEIPFRATYTNEWPIFIFVFGWLIDFFWGAYDWDLPTDFSFRFQCHSLWNAILSLCARKEAKIPRRANELKIAAFFFSKVNQMAN